MPITTLNPYLNFNGTADQAIKLYESALGAKTEVIQRFGDMAGADVPAEQKNRVIHAALRIGGGTLMISDTMPDRPVPPAGNVHVILEFDDPAEETKKFEALAAGGQITMPLADMFWGAKFGMVTDAYGISWMFNCTRKPA
jgi:PhnB protein